MNLWMAEYNLLISTFYLYKYVHRKLMLIMMTLMFYKEGKSLKNGFIQGLRIHVNRGQAGNVSEGSWPAMR